MSKIRDVENDRKDEKLDELRTELDDPHMLRITLDGGHARYEVRMYPTLMSRALVAAFKPLIAKLTFMGLCNVGFRHTLGYWPKRRTQTSLCMLSSTVSVHIGSLRKS
jgi:hypothetical protein